MKFHSYCNDGLKTNVFSIFFYSLDNFDCGSEKFIENTEIQENIRNKHEWLATCTNW